MAKQLGYYKGKHYTQYIEEFRALKKAERLDEAEELLLHLINAVACTSIKRRSWTDYGKKYCGGNC